MKSISSNSALYLSALIWLWTGAALLGKGIYLLLALYPRSDQLLLTTLLGWLGTQERALWLLLLSALTVGSLKSHAILSKTVARNVLRLKRQDSVPLYQIFDRSLVLTICLMALLARLARLLPADARSWVDLTVGSALVQGAIYYLHAARSRAKE